MMTDTTKWELATADEAEALNALYQYATRVGMQNGTTHWDGSYPNEETIAFDLENDGLLVLRDQGAPVAAVSLVEHDDLDELDCWLLDGSCALARLCVSPEHQNKGLGTAAVRAAMAEAANRGYRSMRLMAERANEVTNRLYTKVGFRRAGETRMYDTDFVCYEIGLSPASGDE